MNPRGCQATDAIDVRGCRRAGRSDRVTVVGRRPPAFRRADVLRDIDAGLDGGNKGVLHPAQPDGILAALLAGSGFLP